MKIELLAFICCSFISITNAQTIAAANEALNILYIGVDNPISVAAEGIPKSL